MERKFQDNVDPARLERCLSRKRLHPYLVEARGDTAAALSLYERNVLFSGRLWIIMHFFEITLRNRVDGALSGRYGREWLMPERGLLRPMEIERVLEARETLEQRNKTVTRDGVIAELGLGFWVFLFSRKYDDRVRAFWRRALYRLFPGQRRRDVHDNLQGIRKLRNRLAHHERIHHPVRARGALLDTLQQLSPDMAAWARLIEARMGVSG